MTKESIEQIAKAIKRHRELEMAISATNPAIGKIKTLYDNKEKQFWLINKENTGGYRRQTNIVGFTTGTQEGNRTTITEDGQPVYKNSILGGILIQGGEKDYNTPSGVKKVSVINSATYIPSDKDYANEVVIRLKDDNNVKLYRSLTEILIRIKQLDQEVDKLEAQKEEVELTAQKELIDKIEKAKQERETRIEQAQSFIRKQVELRYQPVLDPWQEEVKRSLLYNGTMAINGGPGTGKTTSLIQRIKFLTDETAISEIKPNLAKNFKEKLFNQKNSWIFFSPNLLLSLYLKNSMIKEGLEADNERVKVWGDFKNDLIKKYKLVNTENQRPFLFLRGSLKELSLFPVEGNEIKKIITAFEESDIKHQKEKLEKISSIDLGAFFWKETGSRIQKYLKQHKNDNLSFSDIIKIFYNLQDLFSNESKEISDEYIKLINAGSARLQLKLKEDEEVLNKVEELEKGWFRTKMDIAESSEIEEDEEELEHEDFDDKELASEFNFELLLNIRLKSIIRKSALRKYDKKVYFSKKEKEILKIINQKEIDKEVKDFEKIGQLAFYKKHFEKITKGIARNLFSEIPIIYKKFRKTELLKFNLNTELLKSIIKKDNNKRLHPEEQAFLIFFINNLIKASFKSFSIHSNKIKHPYFEAYINNSKPVIGIDEATDFHILDLLAMYSLSDREVSSVTFSGDLMQRLTNYGLRNWKDLGKFIKPFVIKDLAVSYRQSYTLLNLASEMYKTINHKEPEYISYMDYDVREPHPLSFFNKDEGEIILWISKRILEIYNTYQRIIPSIAIFLPTGENIESFATKLGDVDELADLGINVIASKDGQYLGHKNTVRIFSIEHIKGLEFEAVFFHNLHKLNNLYDKDLIVKNLYVGLSRATFYLAITGQEQFLNEFSFLSLFKNGEQFNWRI